MHMFSEYVKEQHIDELIKEQQIDELINSLCICFLDMLVEVTTSKCELNEP